MLQRPSPQRPFPAWLPLPAPYRPPCRRSLGMRASDRGPPPVPRPESFATHPRRPPPLRRRPSAVAPVTVRDTLVAASANARDTPGPCLAPILSRRPVPLVLRLRCRARPRRLRRPRARDASAARRAVARDTTAIARAVTAAALTIVWTETFTAREPVIPAPAASGTCDRSGRDSTARDARIAALDPTRETPAKPWLCRTRDGGHRSRRAHNYVRNRARCCCHDTCYRRHSGGLPPALRREPHVRRLPASTAVAPAVATAARDAADRYAGRLLRVRPFRSRLPHVTRASPRRLRRATHRPGRGLPLARRLAPFAMRATRVGNRAGCCCRDTC